MNIESSVTRSAELTRKLNFYAAFSLFYPIVLILLFVHWYGWVTRVKRQTFAVTLWYKIREKGSFHLCTEVQIAPAFLWFGLEM